MNMHTHTAVVTYNNNELQEMKKKKMKLDLVVSIITKKMQEHWLCGKKKSVHWSVNIL